MAAPEITLGRACAAVAAFACASSVLELAAAYPNASGVSALASARQTSAEADDEPICVEAWPEARYRNYGYDHIVHLRSRCEMDAHCSVSSDVNPDPVEVVVPAGEEIEVLTFRGSPARQFTPHVECRFRV